MASVMRRSYISSCRGFSSACFLDIGVISVSSENVSHAVKQGAGASQKPAVFSVEPPDARFCFERLSLRYRKGQELSP
jgi:hypothetical protein